MDKMLEEARTIKPKEYDITVGELNKIYEIIRKKSNDYLFDAILTAFNYGFILGHKATVAGKVMNKKTA